MPNAIIVRPSLRRLARQTFPYSRSSTRAQKTGSGGVVIGGSALIDLSVPSVPSEVTIEWDLDNDGDFSESVEDITSYVTDLETLIGRDFPSQINGRSAPGRLRLTLNNEDDRFSYFNANSPLNQGEFSLKTGRKIRVRTTETTYADPVLLAKDGFNRSLFAAGLETGQSWSQAGSTFGTPATEDGVPSTAMAQIEGGTHSAVVDVGVADYYAQVRLVEIGRNTTGRDDNTCSLVYRWQDSSNFSLVRVTSSFDGGGTIELVDVVAGVVTTIEADLIDIYDNMTIGALVEGTSVTAYLEGVPILSGTAIQTDETEVGIRCVWAVGQERPLFDDFMVWDSLPVATDGVLWTGEITSVNTSVEAGPYKLAVVEAEGNLGKVARQSVVPPVSILGRPTGQLVGEVLASSNALNPPSNQISNGDVTTGPIFSTSPLVSALELSRTYEEAEFGFLFETQEGYIGFQSRTDRDAAVSAVTFSDNPGAQFGYNKLVPYDWKREVINRVTAGVAPQRVNYDTLFVDSNSEAFGTGNPVDIVLPTMEQGDLLVVIICSTVAPPTGDPGGEKWLTPLWWVNERQVDDVAIRQRIYTHISGGDDSGTTVRFYNDFADNGGAWVAYQYLITNWYGSHQGIATAVHRPGSSPGPITVPWGNEPTLFIVTRHGAVSTSGGAIVTPVYPQGYTGGSSDFVNGTLNGFDVAIQAATKNDNVFTEDPGSFGGFQALGNIESTVIAIRGFNGDYPESGAPGSLESGIAQPSGLGITVTKDDIASQQDHNSINTNQTVPRIFLNEEDAEEYCDLVLERYADDRPIFSMTFYPTKGNHYRNQAKIRRVNDRITLIADENSGMGVSGDFFIESVSHKLSQGTKFWECTWELSPAPEGIQALQV